MNIIEENKKLESFLLETTETLSKLDIETYDLEERIKMSPQEMANRIAIDIAASQFHPVIPMPPDEDDKEKTSVAKTKLNWVQQFATERKIK